MKTFTDHRGEALAIGDRVIAIAWGDIPLYLSSSRGTVVGFARTRVRVQFDGIAYGGKFATFDAVPPSYLRRLDDTQ